MSKSQPTKVLYVVAASRSGTTIISEILGQLNGYFCPAETINIWRGVTGDLLRPRCGCGLGYRDCPVWSTVFAEAFGGFDQINAETMEAFQKSLNHHLIDKMFPPRKRWRSNSGIEDYVAATEKLYRAIQIITNSHVIVDSSKNLQYLYLLDSLGALDVSVLHVVRDPRGIAFSQLRARSKSKVQLSPLQSSTLSFARAVYWTKVNLQAELFLKEFKNSGKYLQLRYEDFVASPENSIDAILHLVGDQKIDHTADWPFLDEHTVRLGSGHGIAGNKARFQDGPQRLTHDMEWSQKMKLRDKTIVSLVTFPLLPKYRYLSSPRVSANEQS